MRRHLRRQIITVSGLLAGCLALTLVYLADRRDASPTSRSIDLEGATRTITYVLSDNWLEFPISTFHTEVRITTNANFRPAAAKTSVLPLRTRYAFDYVLVMNDGSESDVQQFHEIATLTDEAMAALTYIDTDALPAFSRTMQIPTRGTIRAIRLRMSETNPLHADVTARLNSKEPIPERETSFRWQRLTSAQQATLYSGSVYPSEYASPSERAALTSSRWVPVGPEGIDGRNYFSRILYNRINEDSDFDTETPGLMTSGLIVEPAGYAVIQVPKKAVGSLQLKVTTDPAGTPTTTDAIAAIYHHLPDGMPPRGYRVNLERGAAGFNVALKGGHLLVVPSTRMTLQVTEHGHKSVVEVTPEPPAISGWILDGKDPLIFAISQGSDLGTPVRIDFRPLSNPRITPAVVSVRLRNKDGDVSANHTFELPWYPSLYERSLSQNLDTGESTKRFLNTSQDVTSVEFESTGPVLISVYVRPPQLPAVTWVPGTSQADTSQADNSQTEKSQAEKPVTRRWFGLDPVNADELRQFSKRLLVRRFELPEYPEASDTRQWTSIVPDATISGREMFVPRELPGEIATDALDVWYAPLKNDQTVNITTSKRTPFDRDVELVWHSLDATDDTTNDKKGERSIVVRAGATLVTKKVLSGSFGVIPLLLPADYDGPISAHFSSDVEVLVNYVADASVPFRRLRRFAISIEPERSIELPVLKKTSARETLSIALYQPHSTEETQIELQLYDTPESPPISDALTFTNRRYLIDASAGQYESWALGTNVPFNDGRTMFYVMDEDLPAGEYHMTIRMVSGAAGYLRVQQATENTSTSRFYLERGQRE